MKTRKANQADILKVSQLWLEMTRELMPQATPNVTWWKKRVFALMSTDAYFMFVVEHGGRILGFIDYLISPEPATSKIHAIGQCLYIRPEYRQTNAAGRLWKIVLKDLKKRGVQVLETICADQQKSFWEKRGFEFEYHLMKKREV